MLKYVCQNPSKQFENMSEYNRTRRNVETCHKILRLTTCQICSKNSKRVEAWQKVIKRVINQRKESKHVETHQNRLKTGQTQKNNAKT